MLKMLLALVTSPLLHSSRGTERRDVEGGVNAGLLITTVVGCITITSHVVN